MSKQGPKTRAKIVVDHTWDRFLLVMAVSSVLLVLIGVGGLALSQSSDGIWSRLFERLALPGSWVVAESLVCVALVLGVLQQTSPEQAFKRLRHLSHHIPTWWVALSASFLTIVPILGLPSVRGILGIPDWVAFVPIPILIGVVLPGAIAFISHLVLWAHWGWVAKGEAASGTDPSESVSLPLPLPDDSVEAAGRNTDPFEPEAFLAWVHSDEPVTLIDQDQFGTGLIARRMAKRLKESKLLTHAIVGPLGSGKSTLGEFLKELMEGDSGTPTVRLIRIELWPFLTTDAALSGILNRMFDELEKEIGVSHLRSIPKQYLDALESLPGFWQSLARWVRGGESNPVKVLERIDELATMLNLRVVVWIDDLERFAGAASVQGYESSKETDRLSPIRALLHALGEQQSITVVVATTSLEAGFDWDKIARYIHQIPLPDPGKTGRILKLFREQCLAGFVRPEVAKNLDLEALNTAWIDPTPPEFQQEFESWELGGTFREHVEGVTRNSGFLPIHQAMVLLCRTPRCLKQALRHVHELWKVERMRGEFQFDQLLAICLLRYGCPKGFAILKDNWSRLRSGGRSSSARFYMAQSQFEKMIQQEGTSVDGDRLKSSDLRFSAMFANTSSNGDAPALRFIGELWRSDLEKYTQYAIQHIAEFLLSEPAKAGPQGFAVDEGRGNAYWILFLDEPPLSTEIRDQPFMRKALRGSIEELADLLSMQATGKALQDFAPALDLELNGLLLTMVERHSCKGWSLNQWRDSYKWPATAFEIFRHARFGSRIRWDFRSEFEESMRIAVDLNPDLAYEIERQFLDQNKFQGWFNDGNDYHLMSARIRELFMERYAERVDELIEKLEIPWALKHLCFGMGLNGHPKDPDPRDVPVRCTELFTSILLRMEGSAEVRNKMLLPIGIVLTSENSRTLNVDLAKTLLGGTDQLFEFVLLEPEPNSEFDQVMTALFQAARSQVAMEEE